MSTFTLTLSEVAQLAEIDVRTARLWFDRRQGHFLYFDDDQLAVAGGTHRLSINTALAVCIAASLRRLGTPLTRGAAAGMTFGRTADGSPPRKHPAALYGGTDLTLLALCGDDTIKIFPVGGKTDPLDLLVHIRDGATVIVIDPIVEKIESAARAASATAGVTAPGLRARST
jgi:hypothetical protein